MIQPWPSSSPSSSSSSQPQAQWWIEDFLTKRPSEGGLPSLSSSPLSCLFPFLPPAYFSSVLIFLPLLLHILSFSTVFCLPHPGKLSLAIRGAMSTGESRGVNRHTARYTSPVCAGVWLGATYRRSAPPYLHDFIFTFLSQYLHHCKAQK